MNEFSIYDAMVAAEAHAASDPDGQLSLCPVLVSWWSGSAYKPHVDRLLASLMNENRSTVEWLLLTSPLDPRGWEANCNRKPRAIQYAMRLLKRPVFWVDADAEFVAPVTTETLIRHLPRGVDLAVMRPKLVHPGRWPLVNSTLMSGTMGFGYTVGADFLLRRWADECEKNSSAYDQETLSGLLDTEGIFMNLIVKDLDPRLICVPDLMPDVKDPIVIHHQASREAECRYQR